MPLVGHIFLAKNVTIRGFGCNIFRLQKFMQLLWGLKILWNEITMTAKSSHQARILQFFWIKSCLICRFLSCNMKEESLLKVKP